MPSADLTGSVRVATTTSVQYTVDAVYAATLPGAVRALQGSAITGTVSVPAHAALDVTYLALPPPTKVDAFTAIADAMVRESRRTLNYGATSTVDVGFSLTENARYRAFFRFDLSALPSNVQIKRATLRLRTPGAAGAQTFAARAVLAGWDEQGITWANQPSVGDVVASARLEAGQTELAIDLTDLVAAWHAGEAHYGLELESAPESVNQIVRWYSREAGGETAPTLDVEHTLPIQAGVHDLAGTASARRSDRSDLGGAIDIASGRADSGLAGHVMARQPYALPGAVTVQGSYAEGHLTVRHAARSELGGAIGVRGLAIEDWPGEVGISRPTLDGHVTLRFHDELDGTAAIRQTDHRSLAGRVGISRRDLAGQAAITHYDDLGGSLAVRQKTGAGLGGRVAARRNAAAGLAGHVSAILGPADRQGHVRVRSPWLRGSLVVPASKELRGGVSVPSHPGGSGLEGTLAVRGQKGDGFPGSVRAIHGPNDLDGRIKVRSGWLAGHVSATLSVSLAGQLTARAFDVSEILGQVMVGGGGDLAGRIAVRGGADADVAGALSVLVHADLIGYAVIVQSATGDLAARVSVSRPATPGAAAVTRPNLPAHVQARQTDAAELSGDVTASRPVLLAHIGVNRRSLAGQVSVPQRYFSAHLRGRLSVSSWVAYADDLHDLLPPAIKVDPGSG